MKNRLMSMARLGVFLPLVLSAPALAQRIAVPSFTGPGAANVRNQLVTAVCDTADCVTATKVVTGGKPDWKKAKKESVLYFVTGNVSKRGKNLTLDLAVLNKAGPPVAKKSFPLEKAGTLSAKNLQAAIDVMRSAFGAAPAPEPTPTPPPPDRTAPPPPPTKTSPPPPPTKTEPVKPEPEKEVPPPEEPPVAKPRGKKKPMLLAVELGSDVLNRRLDYTQASTPNLRRYDLPLFPLPGAKVEFYPLALMRDDLLAGLGVELNFAIAPFLKSRRQSSPDAYPTTAMRIDGGFRFRLAPFSYPIAFTPYLGIRVQSFSVGALPSGERLDGLPNISFVGLRAGLALDIPIVENLLFVFGRFGVLPVFSSGEIISAAFFPNGSAFGLEGAGGVAVQLLPFMQLRASFEYTQYGMSFKTNATDTYVAEGATDRYLGGNAAVRLQF